MAGQLPRGLIIDQDSPADPKDPENTCLICLTSVNEKLRDGIPVYYKYFCNCSGSQGFRCENCVYELIVNYHGVGCGACHSEYRNFRFIRDPNRFQRLSFAQFREGLSDWEWAALWTFLLVIPVGAHIVFDLNLPGLRHFELLKEAVREFTYSINTPGSILNHGAFFLFLILIVGSSVFIASLTVHLNIYLLYCIYDWYTTIGPITALQILNPDGSLRATIHEPQPDLPQLEPPPVEDDDDIIDLVNTLPELDLD